MTIFFPVFIRSSSPAAMRYMRPPITSMMIAIIPMIERRKFKTVVRISTRDLDPERAELLAPLQPKMLPISLRKAGAARARARPTSEAVMMFFPVVSLLSSPAAVIYTKEPMTIMMRERMTMMPWRKPQMEERRPSTVLKERGFPQGVVAT